MSIEYSVLQKMYNITRYKLPYDCGINCITHSYDFTAANIHDFYYP